MIYWGLLGWSNKRPGLEFYRYDETNIPRHKSEWGDLFVEESDFKAEGGTGYGPEGSPVIVITLDRRATKEEMITLTAKIKAVLEKS